MARYAGVVSVMAIVLLAALFASPANCRRLGDEEGASAMALKNSMATSDSVGSLTGAGDFVFCVQRSCIYPNRGSAACYCCSIVKPNQCYDTRGKCNDNCV